MKPKNISFLATGNEIIHGDVQDTNSHYFAKVISDKGGMIYQHMQVSDKQHEIIDALHYLCKNSEAIIITGGLGPTSDDVTRFALAAVINEKLYPNDQAWNHIETRLKTRNLPIAEANRQQALFPLNAELYPNPHGTAFGCRVVWQTKNIFMLPGPPKECRPLFDQYILATLEKLNFLKLIKIYHWLTTGLIEADIATQVDAVAKDYPVETSYCWAYPHLEIKITVSTSEDITPLVKTIDHMLSAHLVPNN